MLFDQIIPLNRISVTIDKAQAALDAASPGTAVIITGKGTVPIRFNVSGTPVAPIWLIADGAEIALPAVVDGQSAISAWTRSNLVIAGWKITGGFRGILAGEGANVRIVDNTILGCAEDGIKCTHGTNYETVGNTVSGCGQEGIDHVEMTDAVIAFNRVINNLGTAAGMFAKGASNRIKIYRNHINGSKSDGISVGGQGTSNAAVINAAGYQITDSDVYENLVENCVEEPYHCKGATNSRLYRNKAVAGATRYCILVAEGKTWSTTFQYSKDVSVSDNMLIGGKTPQVKVVAPSTAIVGPNVRTVFDYVVGPEGTARFALPESVDPRIIELENTIVQMTNTIASLTQERNLAVQQRDQALAARSSASTLITQALAVLNSAS